MELLQLTHTHKAMAPHSSTLAWRIPWTEESGRLQSMGSLESDTTEQLHFHFSLSCIGEGNGNQLQCSCLENPRDRGAWWAAIYGVAQSWTRLKRLSKQASNTHTHTHTHTVLLFLIFWGISMLFSIVATPIYIPTKSAQVFSFPHILINTCYFFFNFF